jgi:hypothetical protein
MNTSSNTSASLLTLVKVFKKSVDPRDPRGIRHDYHGTLILVFLGLLARLPYMAHIQRWGARYWDILREPLGFKREKPPVDTTISRILAKTSLKELQDAFADFLNAILMEDNDTLVAAVDGKTAKQSFDENGDPIHMLNVFLHDIKVTLNQWSVRGDKTNEPGCLKLHLEELFDKYPALKLLTGDAIFAQRPLLEILKKHGCDYLFQVKANQGDTHEAVKLCFQGAETIEPDYVDYGKSYAKKKGTLTSENSGATSTMPITFVKS